MFNLHVGSHSQGEGSRQTRQGSQRFVSPQSDTIAMNRGEPIPDEYFYEEYHARDEFCCPQGTHYNADYDCCVPDAVPANMRCSCPPHMHYNAEIGSCVYDELEDGSCPQGMSSDGNGGCVRNPIPVCPRGFRYDETVNGCVKDLNCCRNEHSFVQCTLKCPEPCRPPHHHSPCDSDWHDDSKNHHHYQTPQTLPEYLPKPKPLADQVIINAGAEAGTMHQHYTPNVSSELCPEGYAYVPSLGLCVQESFLLDSLQTK